MKLQLGKYIFSRSHTRVTLHFFHIYLPYIHHHSFVESNCSSCGILVQSLNSPFFPPHIGAEPERAKEESRITFMRMLRTPPFFPPKSGEKPYLEVFSIFGFWRNFLNDNIQATISAFRLIKNKSINPKSVEFHQCHAKPHSICFFSQYQG